MGIRMRQADFPGRGEYHACAGAANSRRDPEHIKEEERSQRHSRDFDGHSRHTYWHTPAIEASPAWSQDPAAARFPLVAGPVSPRQSLTPPRELRTEQRGG